MPKSLQPSFVSFFSDFQGTFQQSHSTALTGCKASNFHGRIFCASGAAVLPFFDRSLDSLLSWWPPKAQVRGRLTWPGWMYPLVWASRAIPTIMGGDLLSAAYEISQKLSSSYASTCLVVAHCKLVVVVKDAVWPSPLCWAKTSSSKPAKHSSNSKVNFPPSSWFNSGLIQYTPRSHMPVIVRGNGVIEQSG